MIGNVTFLFDQNNYGQRLQCFALQRHVKRVFGEDVATLDLRKGVSFDDGKFFHAFERDCMNIIPAVNAPIGLLHDFRKVIFGGDQVLNYAFANNVYVRFMTKSDSRKKNVFSYGAGLGPSHKIPNDMLSILDSSVFAYGLREGCHGFPHVKTIDPVFLLDINSWNELAEKHTQSFRGDVTYIVKGGQSDILSIEGHDGEKKNLISRGYGKRYAPDPRIFVGLFGSADSLTTNSFHGFAFGLMFGVKRIKLLNPSDHRIRNLIDMLGVSFGEDNVITNYEEVSRSIKRWVLRGDIFLESCLRKDPKIVAAYSRDKSIRGKSSSGGFCAELARVAAKNSGVVYGGAFSSDFKRVVTTKVRTLEDYMSKLSQSKYSFCFLPKLSDIMEEVSSGKMVVFIGSPCQTFALRLFMNVVPDNCILVDFRCRGYSKPKILSEFVSKANEDGGKIQSISFRHKHMANNVRVCFLSGKTVDYGREWYIRHVMDEKYHIPACKTCRFRHGMISCSDITVGDFWGNSRNKLKLGQEFTPERGYNIVCINTEKGRRMFDLVKGNLEFLDINDGKAETGQEKAVLKPSDVTRYVICQAIKSRFYDI